MPCLVPADGWYEWKVQERGPKLPHFFHRPDDKGFYFAGLAATDASGDRTMAILTCDANSVSQPIQKRMPVVLPDAEAAAAWIDPDTARSTLQELLAPVSNDYKDVYAIRREVNKPENDIPEVIQPVGEG